MSSAAPTARTAEALVEELVDSTREVFTTMIHSEIRCGAPIAGDALRPRSNVVGTVSFAGPESGIVAFYCTFDGAAAMAEALLGAPVQDRNEVADAAGELTNMIAGTFRNRLAADGGSWAISIPSVTIGSDFYTKFVSDVSRVLCPFHTGGHELFVELILTPRRS